jgi:signal peptidase II
VNSGGFDILFYFFFVAVLTADQVSKAIIMKTMYLGQSTPVINKVFHITYIHNPGAAFSLLAGRTSLFIFISFAVIAGVFLYQYRTRQKLGFVPVSLGLIAGGAAGNLLDRIKLGQVVDFIDFRIWPVFNLADSAIVVGAILLGIALFRSEGHA